MLIDDLLELQRIDTTSDQLIHRRAHLAERESAATALAGRRDAERRRAASVARNEELEQAIAALEHDGEALTTQRTRLNAQLRTVAAPREAEALMHELEDVARRRDELDDQELEHLDEQAALQTALAALAADEPALVTATEETAAALAAAEALIDDELTALGAARVEVVGRVDGPMLERYERLRARLGGVAVARVEGSRCSGCHLDLSPAELADVRSAPDGEFADCPQCGRLLAP